MRISSNDLPEREVELQLLPEKWYELPDAELEVLFEQMRGAQALAASTPRVRKASVPKEPAKPKVQGFIIKSKEE